MTTQDVYALMFIMAKLPNEPLTPPISGTTEQAQYIIQGLVPQLVSQVEAFLRNGNFSFWKGTGDDLKFVSNYTSLGMINVRTLPQVLGSSVIYTLANNDTVVGMKLSDNGRWLFHFNPKNGKSGWSAISSYLVKSPG